MKTTRGIIEDEVIKWRRHFHENPELSYEEYKTSEYIYNLLKNFSGLEVTRPTKTSVLAVLKGLKESSENQYTIAFRADIDALPIKEETDVEFKSKNHGVMHACGHDAHAAMLLGAAKILSNNRKEIHGEIRFIFQHAEEVLPGGASELVEKGVLEGVDYAFALHVTPHEKTGTICIREGVFCAIADDFELKIIGRGGHASTPELTIDPLIIGAEIAVSIQQIVSRKIAVLKAPVVSITKFTSGSALNVIPEYAELGGTIRSLDHDSRVKAREFLEQIVKGITEAHGASYEMLWYLGYPAVVNEKNAVDISRAVVEEVCGKNNVINVEEPFFGTEDFSAYSEVVPSSMQFIGVHNADSGKAFPLHHPKFMIDEKALKYGVEYFVGIANKLCSVKQSPVDIFK
ncbi:N-acyl-L-amino acid amidohydrolase [Siminovitchia terrae]|uniref:N-acyl-L-amino acid amidohydrolase n=1 Tax=Siminovitchia terrae TaxID=1914933 RepID=A0ABQ4KTR1_SIMTE|nr:amidohydrolase [Siminovitchia terrae]GIN94860.1 N-acyl-L-amino acid amidohydrolase [Siminovitchia terrae]